MEKPLWKRKRLWLLVILLMLSCWLLSFRGFRVLLQTTPTYPRGLAATPSLSAETLSTWESSKSQIQIDLEREIYGSYPDQVELSESHSAQLQGRFFNDTAKIEVFRFDLRNKDNGKTRTFGFSLVAPNHIQGPVPLLLVQSFCPVSDVIPVKGIPASQSDFSCGTPGMMNDLMHYVFGTYIVSPPFEDLMRNGYALGILHPPEFIPDDSVAGQNALDDFFSNFSDETRPAALMSWAMQSVLLADKFSRDEAFSSIIAQGHSRYGKTALLAAAYSANIDGVIAHQSGTAGASLFRDKPGETLSDLVSIYPHWLGSAAKNFVGREVELSQDQHALLALIAPRPVLLGNAGRDVWSDPEGAFRAALGANRVYELYDKSGLKAETLNDYRPIDQIAFWLRPGTHGVVTEDWPAFMTFLDKHFKTN